jgi:sulfur relay (sulfurtransferase) DsrC/TusE family protein
MKAVIDFLNLLKESVVLCFMHYENFPAQDSDEIIRHFHILERITVGKRSFQAHEYTALFNDSHKNTIAYLNDYYFDNIDSPARLQAVYNDLSQQLSEVTERYRSIKIRENTIFYSTRVILQVQTASETCELSGIEFPFYEGFAIEGLSYEEHFQIIRNLKEFYEQETEKVESFRSLLRKFDKEPEKKVYYDKMPDALLKKIYNSFAKYFEYDTQEQFVKAINNMEPIKYIDKHSNQIAFLFYEVLKKHQIKGRSHILLSLCGVKNKPREQVTDKPIMKETDDFLAAMD